MMRRTPAPEKLRVASGAPASAATKGHILRANAKSLRSAPPHVEGRPRAEGAAETGRAEARRPTAAAGSLPRRDPNRTPAVETRLQNHDGILCLIGTVRSGPSLFWMAPKNSSLRSVSSVLTASWPSARRDGESTSLLRVLAGS